MTCIRLLLIDPDARVRVGLQMRLELEPDLKVVADAADVASAFAVATTACPDVILLDVGASSRNELDVSVKDARRTCGAPVIVLSFMDDCFTRRYASAAGAAAFVGKQEGVDLLLETIRRVGRHNGARSIRVDRAQPDQSSHRVA